MGKKVKKIKAIYIIIEFAVTVTFIIILMKIFNKKNRQIRRAWAKLQRYLIGYKLEVEGEPDEDAKLLILNHQSMLDIVVLEEIHPKNLAWVAKKEIGEIPFFGQILNIPKMIAIDRESKASLVKLFKEAEDRLQDDRPIVIFPEGTRGKGDKLLRFKAGAKLLAQKLKLKVQPILIIGTKKVFDSKNMSSQSGTIKVIYLDSIDVTKDKDWYEKIYKVMSDKFLEYKNKI